jgi:Xaa-Pro aminopeptidase
MPELEAKLEQVRAALASAGLAGARLRGTDWFSWLTCGGSNAVLLTTGSGVAEALVTAGGAWVLTDVIEASRLATEELPRSLPVVAVPWQDPGEERDLLVRDRCGSGPVASDLPAAGEVPLPDALVRARWSLLPEERERYRRLGRDAAEAMTEVLTAAAPDWTGYELAGAGAEALWSRGMHPALTLVGGEARVALHRHATASGERLGARAMLVFCARRHGLFANLTRFVYFRDPSAEERRLTAGVAEVEAAALDASRPGATLGAIYRAIAHAYAAAGHPGAEDLHHQGGPCGYLSRDVVARPSSKEAIAPWGAVAWNPSLPGAKIEDTILVSDTGAHEILTADPRWPACTIAGRLRPEPLVR